MGKAIPTRVPRNPELPVRAASLCWGFVNMQQAISLNPQLTSP